MFCMLRIHGILPGVVSGAVERRGVHKRPRKGAQKNQGGRFPLDSVAADSRRRNRVSETAKPLFFFYMGPQISGLALSRRTKADSACSMM